MDASRGDSAHKKPKPRIGASAWWEDRLTASHGCRSGLWAVRASRVTGDRHDPLPPPIGPCTPRLNNKSRGRSNPRDIGIRRCHRPKIASVILITSGISSLIGLWPISWSATSRGRLPSEDWQYPPIGCQRAKLPHLGNADQVISRRQRLQLEPEGLSKQTFQAIAPHGRSELATDRQSEPRIGQAVRHGIDNQKPVRRRVPTAEHPRESLHTRQPSCFTEPPFHRNSIPFTEIAVRSGLIL